MLHGPYHQARPGQYYYGTQGNIAYLAAAQRTASTSESMNAFLQNTPEAQTADSPWDSLVPQPVDNMSPFAAWTDGGGVPAETINPNWVSPTLAAGDLLRRPQNLLLPMTMNPGTARTRTLPRTTQNISSLSPASRICRPPKPPSTSTCNTAVANECGGVVQEPVRRFRRTFKRFKHTYYRRKGCGKQRGFLWTSDATQALFKGK